VRARNEVLDTVVYALAALKALETEGLKLPVAVEDRRAREERAARRAVEPVKPPAVAPRQRVVPGYEPERF
jgi:phage terminase large subunit GpA-like protein